MTDTEERAALTGLDEALDAVKAVAHMHGLDTLTKQHLEFAGAHIREAWIAQSGQNARPTDKLHNDVASMYRLMARLNKIPG